MNAPTALPNLLAWAARRGQPVTIFDLETTTFVPHVKWQGITEVALLTVHPDGRLEKTSSLVDPERNVPPRVRELTGITNEMVKGQPTWAAWAERLRELARDHVMIGYNSSAFDCIVVTLQNERYGVGETEFRASLDAMALPDVQGRLVDAAATHGIDVQGAHRAMQDVWTTAKLVDAVAATHGLDVLEAVLGKVFRRGGASSPRAEREQELKSYFAEHRELPDLAEFAERHGIKPTTAEGDVMRIIKAGEMTLAVLEEPNVQEWLVTRLPVAIGHCWSGEQEGRLKPLMEYLDTGAPEGFDYTQLKCGLQRLGH